MIHPRIHTAYERNIQNSYLKIHPHKDDQRDGFMNNIMSEYLTPNIWDIQDNQPVWHHIRTVNQL